MAPSAGTTPTITKCLMGKLAAVYPQPDHSPTQSHHRVVENGSTYQEEEGGVSTTGKHTRNQKGTTSCDNAWGHPHTSPPEGSKYTIGTRR